MVHLPILHRPRCHAQVSRRELDFEHRSALGCQSRQQIRAMRNNDEGLAIVYDAQAGPLARSNSPLLALLVSTLAARTQRPTKFDDTTAFNRINAIHSLVALGQACQRSRSSRTSDTSQFAPAVEPCTARLVLRIRVGGVRQNVPYAHSRIC